MAGDYNEIKKMKYLNLGCAYTYSTGKEWINLDFISTGADVIAHDLLNGIPFENNSFDLVYHSHVLEHFSKEDGEKIIAECFRVLKPGGIIRIAIPDLEMILRNYLRYLEQGLNSPNDETIRYNYDWMMIEMYDQAVRNHSGGNMQKYLFNENLKNEDFIFERIGEEGRALRRNYFAIKENLSTINNNTIIKKSSEKLIPKIKRSIKKYLIKKLKIDEGAMAIGRFRLNGEIHQWMYDRYSLTALLIKNGAKSIQIRDAFTSFINNWANYDLDGKNGIVRKPDSLFVEAIKK